MPHEEHIALLRAAAGATAEQLCRHEGRIVEKTLERKFNAALCAISGRQCGQSRLVLGNWNPQPGSFDSALGPPSRPEMVGEMKWSSQNKLFEVLWDAIKLCSEFDRAAPTAFLAYGFPCRLWDKPVECASMFGPGMQPLIPMICKHINWWNKYILGDSTGRPIWACHSMNVTAVADEQVQYQRQSWLLRVVMVEGAGPAVPFENGRPVCDS